MRTFLIRAICAITLCLPLAAGAGSMTGTSMGGGAAASSGGSAPPDGDYVKRAGDTMTGALKINTSGTAASLTAAGRVSAGGGVRLNTDGAQPSCDAATVGLLWVRQNTDWPTIAEPDQLWLCRRWYSAGTTAYEWELISRGGVAGAGVASIRPTCIEDFYGLLWVEQVGDSSSRLTYCGYDHEQQADAWLVAGAGSGGDPSGDYVLKAGDTMTGTLVAPRVDVERLHATTARQTIYNDAGTPIANFFRDGTLRLGANATDATARLQVDGALAVDGDINLSTGNFYVSNRSITADASTTSALRLSAGALLGAGDLHFVMDSDNNSTTSFIRWGANSVSIGSAGTLMHLRESGNLHIGYNDATVDNGYLLDVNGSARVVNGLDLGGSISFNSASSTTFASGSEINVGGVMVIAGQFAPATHASGSAVGLPRSFGTPAPHAGTYDGNLVWDSTNRTLFAYSSSLGKFEAITGGGPGGNYVQISGDTMTGKLTAPDIDVQTKLTTGSVFVGITHGTGNMIDVRDDDGQHTAFCDASAGPVEIIIPRPADQPGRIIRFVKTDTTDNPCSMRTYDNNNIWTPGDTRSSNAEIRTTLGRGGTCTVQADGVSAWWVIAGAACQPGT